MSHCTKFDFQYTNRKIIFNTFEALGLKCEHSLVASFSSVWEKKLGINATDQTPAIIAESNGFNYFMLNCGSHYELFIEKHNMTTEEARISKKMADEFQKAYLEETVKEAVKQLTASGQTALWEKDKNGYVIKFGALYDKTIYVKLNGKKTVEEAVVGVKGPSCVSLTEAIENMLSSAEVELNSEWTKEYYQEETDNLEIYELN